MIKAGSLTYAIFLALVIAILCSMMIMLAYANRSFFNQMNKEWVLRDNAYSGIAWLMAKESAADYQNWIELYGEGGDSVFMKRRRWGAYQVLTSKAVLGSAHRVKTAVIGHVSEELGKTALWIKDQSKPIKLAGKALLKGRCYLPVKGVHRSFIEGVSYERERLVYGESTLSRDYSLVPDKKLFEYWESYFNRQYVAMDSVIAFEGLKDSLDHPFSKATIVAYSINPIDLRGFRLGNNIIVQSGNSIKVDETTSLENVILIAPKIIVAGGQDLTGHLIASDTIVIRDGSRWFYPSSIMMIPSTGASGYIALESGANVAGTILCSDKEVYSGNSLSVSVSDDAVVKGLLYCEGNLQLRGQVLGTVVVENLLLITPSGSYDNHMLNGRIDRTLLAHNFPTCSFEDDINQKQVAVWVQ